MRGIIWGMGCGGIILIRIISRREMGGGGFGGVWEGERGLYQCVWGGVGVGVGCGYDMTFYLLLCLYVNESKSVYVFCYSLLKVGGIMYICM